MILYNEIDPFAAAWLGQLAERNLINPGRVETRSISDLTTNDVRDATQAHFFAGIGVWSYALRLANWPDDCPIWTGSCPCQPFSTAGRKKGFSDDRHLWPAWQALIAECRPAIVVGEQVAGPDGRAWLDLVLDGLERLGYAVGASVLPACGVGAPHRRERIYFCAIANDDARVDVVRKKLRERRKSVDDYVGPRLEVQREQLAWAWEGPTTERGREARDLANTERHNGAGRIRSPHGRQTIERDRAMANAAGARLDRSEVAREDRGNEGERAKASERRSTRLREPERDCSDDTSAMSDASESRSGGAAGGVSRAQGSGGSERIDARHLAHVAQLASANGATRGFWADADYVACRDPKRGILYRPVEPGAFPLAHGAPSRVGRIRGYGNGLVSEVAATFLEALAQTIIEA